MVKAAAFTVIFLAACLGMSLARPVEVAHAARRSAIGGANTPVGWWYSLKTKAANGTDLYCTLREFPPKGGYGTSHVYCTSTTFNHLFMWRMTKASGVGGISSGDEVLLWTYNTIGKFCQYKGTVLCGVSSVQASKFVIEKVSGTGPVNLTSDAFYLKFNGSYCSLSGTGRSQQLKCATPAASKAAVFHFPTGSFVYANLVNQLSGIPCGGNFMRYEGVSDGVYCGAPTYMLKPTNLTIGFKVPGGQVVEAGAAVTFKVYDDLYSYYTGIWRQVGNEIKFVEEDDFTVKQFFTLERLTGPATGGPLLGNTSVALRSTLSGTYCGISSTNQAAITCDNAGPLSALPAGYRYKYSTAMNY